MGQSWLELIQVTLIFVHSPLYWTSYSSLGKFLMFWTSYSCFGQVTLVWANYSCFGQVTLVLDKLLEF